MIADLVITGGTIVTSDDGDNCREQGGYPERWRLLAGQVARDAA